MRRSLSPLGLLALAMTAGALALPLAQAVVVAAVDPDADPLDAPPVTLLPVGWTARPLAMTLAAVLGVALLVTLIRTRNRVVSAGLLALGSMAGLAPALLLLGEGLRLAAGAFLLTGAAMLALWRVLVLLSAMTGLLRDVVVPALFGLMILYAWEVGVRGFGVPLILLPPPSLVAATIAGQGPVLWSDFVQTVLHSALIGYVIGCGSGFLLALVCDRFGWLGRGLLPFGNLLSAVPMVGLAPIMIMWFGFGWPSKAAVVVVATFFPMLVNTLVGLGQSERLERDLMRSYAAGPWQTLWRLRLPHALPFIFTALKINATFALIGAIVAEFFGTPIMGMGFRISTEVARMNLGMVWATIAVAALTGSLSYGALALLERATTAWHPSYRQP